MHLRELQEALALSPWKRRWIIYAAFALFPLLTVSSEKPSEASNTTQHLNMHGIRRLLINIPCLPCYKKDKMGCRKRFGCVLKGDGSVTSLLWPMAITSDQEKTTGAAKGAAHPEDSPCLPCYSYHWHGHCRKIRGCVSRTTPPTEATTLFPMTEVTSGLAPEDDGSTPPEDAGLSGSSDPHQEPTEVPPTSSSNLPLVPSVETSTENSSESPLSTIFPSIRTLAPTSTKPQVNESDQPTSSS